MEIAKPLPEDIAFEAPYWEGASRRELVLQRCKQSNIYLHPPLLGAPHWAPEEELEWVSLGSDIIGTVHSFTIVHRAFNKSFVADVPYAVAMCDIAEAPGARIMANVIGLPPEDVHIGLKVKMFWEPRGEETMLPQWGPLP